MASTKARLLKHDFPFTEQLVVCNFHAEALSCALLRICVCAFLRSFASFFRPTAFRMTALAKF